MCVWTSGYYIIHANLVKESYVQTLHNVTHTTIHHRRIVPPHNQLSPPKRRLLPVTLSVSQLISAYTPSPLHRSSPRISEAIYRTDTPLHTTMYLIPEKNAHHSLCRQHPSKKHASLCFYSTTQHNATYVTTTAAKFITMHQHRHSTQSKNTYTPPHKGKHLPVTLSPKNTHQPPITSKRDTHHRHHQLQYYIHKSKAIYKGIPKC